MMYLLIKASDFR